MSDDTHNALSAESQEVKEKRELLFKLADLEQRGETMFFRKFSVNDEQESCLKCHNMRKSRLKNR